MLRIAAGGPGAPGDLPGRRGRRLLGLGFVIAIGLPILMAAGVGLGVYQTLFRVPEFRALLFDLRTGRSLASVTAEVETASWEGVAWSDEAAWLTIASPYRVDLRTGAIARAWPWQTLANCQNIGGKIVCTR